MYLVSNDCGDFLGILDCKQLKEVVIDELGEHIKENTDVKEIVENGVNRLKFYAKNEVNARTIVSDLEGFGWYTDRIIDIQSGVNNLRTYWALNHTDTKVFDDLLEFIDKVILK